MAETKQQRRPVMLVVLDGWGWREETADNAVRQANTPTFDRLWANGPHAFLRTDGREVGQELFRHFHREAPIHGAGGMAGEMQQPLRSRGSTGKVICQQPHKAQRRLEVLLFPRAVGRATAQASRGGR